ncbi:hypothetical protein RvY_12379-2 [Ramazzottius varieornatus]|uniref:tRNA (34-2'-O)-methyltransferase regulator WDR6 n=1 Tax=Ramazzottius varieornatus TaxID=947166 RepID=A0A1D1VPR9_RAMVA|nr:hypothetical protein RvY_12379-2 [Ramazzottius varieornatus]
MVDHESAMQPTQTDKRSGTVTHRLTSSTLAIYKAVLALDTILTKGDKRWLLYVQSCWLLARPIRWTAQSSTNSCGPPPSSPTDTSGEEKAVRAFKESDIHGICVNDRKSFTSGEFDCTLPTRICVYGDHSFRVFKACASSQEHISFRSVCEEQVLDDWIITARILTDDRIALISAHNRLCLFNADASVCHSTISCKDFHILYSAFIHEEMNSDAAGAHNGQLVIFGGTVSNYLSIWSPEIPDELPSRMSCATLHKLQGHSGVIFDIKFDGSQQLLCSTSDDRSCRIYRVVFPSSASSQSIGRQKWAGASFQLLQAVFGHEARVWRVLILANLRLLTIGEDLRLCLWNAADGGLIKQWSGQHSGLNIWSVTAEQVNQDWVEIFTGGADGSIIQNGFSTSARNNGGMMGGDTRSSVAPSSKRVRHVAIMEEDQLLIVVDGGLLYSVQVAKGQWTLRWQDVALKQCVALTSHKGLRKTAIITCTGLVAIYDAGHTAQMKWLVDVSCHCLQALWISGAGQKAVSLLVSGPSQVFHLLAYDSAKTLLEKTATLRMPQNTWITAAAQVEHVLICGDRAGSLRIFQLEEDRWQEGEVLLHVHGDSQVCQVEDSSDGVVVTAGRSGQVICWRLTGSRLDKLRVMQVDKSIIEWMSGFVLPAGKVTDLVVLGFRGRKFVALAMAGQDKVMEVDCGGAHRSNDWAYFTASALARFAFVKTTSVKWRDAQLLSRAAAQRPSLVRVGLHGLQIWSAGCLQSAEGRGWTLATASEDTSIKIWTVSPLDDMTAAAPPKGLTALLATAQQHLSSVRVLKQSLLMPNSLYRLKSGGQEIIIFSNSLSLSV